MQVSGADEMTHEQATKMAHKKCMELMADFDAFKKLNPSLENHAVVQAWTAKKMAELFIMMSALLDDMACS